MKKKLKILFISSDKFPPFRVDVVDLFAKELVSRNHSIEWILQSATDCNHNYKTTWLNSTVWVGKTDNGTSLISRLKKHLYSIKNDFKLYKLSKHNTYDIIQVKDKFISALVAIITKKITGKKFVYWLSFPFPEDSLYRFYDKSARYPLLYFIRGNVLKVLLYKIICRSADHIFVQSEQMKMDITKHGVPLRKMTPIPMGVPEENIVDQKNSHNKTVNPNQVIYLGTLNRSRKMDFVLRAFKLALQKKDYCELIFVGDSEDPGDKEFLIEESKKLGIDHAVSFTGLLARDKALEYVEQSAVCLSPFYPTPVLNSTSPTKLIEYMALQKPVIANDHPEQRLVLKESQGGICVPYEEQAFANAIIYLLDNPDIAKNMGRMGREYIIKNRTYRTIADQVEQKYFEILEN